MSSSNPFGRLLGRLSVGRKLALIYLLDLTAVIYVSSILINEKFIGIDFARKELAGNTSIVGVREALVGATLAANDPASSAVAGAAAARRLQQMEVNYGSGMQSADLNAGLSAKLDQLARTPTIDRSTAVSAVLATGPDLLTRSGNQSNLILDPDLDSYYTMSLIVLRYPELLEIIDNIGRPVATPATSALEVSEARTRYLILEGKIDATMQGIASDYSEAWRHRARALRLRSTPPVNDWRRRPSAFIRKHAPPLSRVARRRAWRRFSRPVISCLAICRRPGQWLAMHSRSCSSNASAVAARLHCCGRW